MYFFKLPIIVVLDAFMKRRVCEYLFLSFFVYNSVLAGQLSL